MLLGGTSPNAILAALRAEGVSNERILECARVLGMDEMPGAVLGDATQWEALDSAFKHNYADLIGG